MTPADSAACRGCQVRAETIRWARHILTVLLEKGSPDEYCRSVIEAVVRNLGPNNPRLRSLEREHEDAQGAAGARVEP